MRTATLLSTTLLALTLALHYAGAAAASAQLLTPAAPSGLTATAVSNSAIFIEWTDNSDNEAGFKIEQCQGSGCTDFVTAGYVSAGATNATSWNLAKNKTYSFRVRAYNDLGNSDYSNTAWATTLR
jgi:hypothetical protein